MVGQQVENLQERARNALSGSPIHELRELRVEHREDGLHLQGVVSSYYHKQLAQEVVRSVTTGVRVFNSIRVH